MPFSIQNLLEDRGKPVSVNVDEPVQRALDLMVEHDFSQLPVIDENQKPLGLVTNDSILRALNSFDVKIEALRVGDALARAYTFYPEDDLFDVLDQLQARYAVLIIDREEKLVGIITSFDSAEYFRQRAEDMMLVEDIEGMLKDYILMSFTGADDDVDETGLNEAVQKITGSHSSLPEKVRAALSHYLGLHSKKHGPVKPDAELVDQVIAQRFSEKPRTRSFDDLTMYEFITLFLHRDRWAQYEPAFSLGREAISTLLNNVRKSRNILAHFKGELSPTRRDQLRFCADWLDRHQSKALAAFALPSLQTQVDDTLSVRDDGISVSEEELEIDALESRESRYAALALFLQRQSPKTDSLNLTFDQIEKIIKGDLPASAYNHRAWWSNNISHVQSRQWLSVDWKVASVNLTEQRVKFSRIKERARLYIEFFNAFLEELRMEKPDFPLTESRSPDGRHYFRVAPMPTDRPNYRIGHLTVSFNRSQILRVQLDISQGDQAQNKQIFDALYARKGSIEEAFGQSLIWQRLDDNRKSRIAIARSGAIDVSAETLQALLDWAVETMIHFKQALDPPLTEVVDQYFEEQK